MLDSLSERNWGKDLILIFVAAMLLNLGLAFMRPLANPDEGRYAEIPREMVASGDYVTPRLNGLPYFYKPPLFYWAQCASLKAFGVNRVSIRLASSLMAVLGILATYAAARALYGRRAGLMSAAVLLTTHLYYVMGIIVTLDMMVSVFMSAAMFSFIVAIKKSGAWRNALILAFFVFCGLAVMTKGVIGILIPCAVAFLYVVSGGISGIVGFFKDLKASNYLFMLFGVAAFFAINIPWHALVSVANPAFENAEGVFSKNPDGQGFFWYYFIHEHLLRYIDPSTSMRAQPFWFFLVIAPAGALPWLFFAPRIFLNTKNGGSVDTRDCRDVFLYMAIWVVFIVAFFSVSSSKLVPYITAVYPAIAFIIGVWAARAWDNLDGIRNIKFAQYLFGFLGFAAAIALPIVYAIMSKKPREAEVLEVAFYTMILATVGFVAVSVACLVFARKNQNRKFWITAFFGTVLLVAIVNPIAGMGQRVSAEKTADYIKAHRAGQPVAIGFDYGRYHDLPVWLDELPALIGEPPTEQYFGWLREKDLHRDRIFPDAASLEAFLKKNPVLWVAVVDDDLGKFDKLNLPLSKKVLFKNADLLLLEISLKADGAQAAK